MTNDWLRHRSNFESNIILRLGDIIFGIAMSNRRLSFYTYYKDENPIKPEAPGNTRLVTSSFF